MSSLEVFTLPSQAAGAKRRCRPMSLQREQAEAPPEDEAEAYHLRLRPPIKGFSAATFSFLVVPSAVVGFTVSPIPMLVFRVPQLSLHAYLQHASRVCRALPNQ